MNVLEIIGSNERHEVGGNGIFTFLNPYSYLLARQHVGIFSKFNAIMVDGEYLAKFLRFFCRLSVTRASFDMTSLAPQVFAWAVANNKSVALVGSTNDSIKGAMEKIHQAYPGLKIAYARNGFFGNLAERDACLTELHELSPAVVVVGMGTPLQEHFLLDLWNRGWRGAGYTCGGFFHQTARGLHYYPDWINRWNLRWLYRIYDEPKLFSRYAVKYPKFVALFLVDWVRWMLSKRAR